MKIELTMNEAFELSQALDTMIAVHGENGSRNSKDFLIAVSEKVRRATVDELNYEKLKADEIAGRFRFNERGNE